MSPRRRATGGRLLWFGLFYVLSLLVFTAMVYLIRTIAR